MGSPYCLYDYEVNCAEIFFPKVSYLTIQLLKYALDDQLKCMAWAQEKQTNWIYNPKMCYSPHSCPIALGDSFKGDTYNSFIEEQKHWVCLHPSFGFHIL